MKKTVFILIIVLCGLSIKEEVKAGQQINIENIQDYTQDYNEIYELEDDITALINDARRMNGDDELPQDFEVDFTNSYKVFIDSDIFSLNSDSKASIMQLLNEGEYVWSLFLQADNNYYIVNISKGLPLRDEAASLLSEDEINRIKSEEGKWIVSGISKLEYEISYDDIINNALKNTHYYEEDVEVVLCGGLKCIHYPVAVIMYEGNAQLIVPLYELEVKGTSEQMRRALPEGASEKDNVYNYDSIKNAVNKMSAEEEYNDMSGSGSVVILSDMSESGVNQNENMLYYFSVIAVVIIITGVACVVVYKKRAKRE